MRIPFRSMAMLAVVSFLACENQPYESTDVTNPVFKPKCESPPCKDDGGTDPPPPPPASVEAHILYSSGIESNVGGGGCKRGDLQHSVYRMDPTGAFERLFGNDLESQAHTMNPSFSPDGQQFAMSRDVYTVAKGRCATEHFQIATANVDGTGFQVIREVERSSGQFVENGLWSPAAVDGAERIAWLEWDGNVTTSVVIAETDGASPVPVIVQAEPDEIEDHEWNRTGDGILVMMRDWAAGQSSLRLYGIDCSGSCQTSSQTDIGDLSPIPSSSPLGGMAWAHQHDWVALHACAGGDCDIYRIDLTDPLSPIVTQLTARGGGADELDPRWSPDDTKVIFAAGPIDGTEWLVEMDLTVTSLPWDGDLSAPGIRLLVELGPFGGSDWRSF